MAKPVSALNKFASASVFILATAGLVLCPLNATAQDAPVTFETDAPIITDSDFDAALPPLGETLPQPVAPAKDTANATPETPTDNPPAADALPDLIISQDEALDKPLVPLEGFDVQPNQTVATEMAQAQIRYTTNIDGLRAIGLNDAFKSLSALQGGKGKAVNAAMVRARATEDEALILRLLESKGYYDGTVSTQITASEDPAAPVNANIIVVPGKPYHFGLVAIQSTPTTPRDLIRKALPIQTGDQIIATEVLAAEANVSVVLPQNGYPFAKVGKRDILLDGADLSGDYTLNVETGARSRFGGFSSDGNEAFDASHVAIMTRFDHGDLYDNRQVDDLREALVATGLFRSVAVEPVATGQFSDDGTQYVDLLIHQQKGPYHTLAAQAGYSTGEGFATTASWQNRNLLPPEGALIVTAALGTQAQGLTTTFRRSNAKKRDRTFQLGMGASHNVYDSYEAYTAGINGSISRVSTPLWQKVWTWSYGFEIQASRESSGKLKSGFSNADDYYIATLPTKVGYDRSDSLLNPTKGYRLSAEVTPQVSLSGGGSSLRNVLDATYYYPLNDQSVIAARTRFGTLIGGNLNDIAPSRRLYAGGGGSVRGYAYQQLGPKDASQNPTGGLSLFEASVEYRYRFGDLGIVPFIDIGQAYATTTPSFSDLRVGVGIGARLYTNFGPIRIDIATPLSRKKEEPIVALYVGIGQAF